MPGALNSGSPPSLADWDLRGKLFFPLMHKCFSSPVTIRKVIGVAQIALRRLALRQPHPSDCLVDLLYVLLEVRSGYKSLITFWKPILDILFPLKALAGISALKTALAIPSGAGRCSNSAHLVCGDGWGGTGRREGVTMPYSIFSTPSRMFSDKQQTKQMNKSLIRDLNYHLLNLLTAASSVTAF